MKSKDVSAKFQHDRDFRKMTIILDHIKIIAPIQRTNQCNVFFDHGQYITIDENYYAFIDQFNRIMDYEINSIPKR